MLCFTTLSWKLVPLKYLGMQQRTEQLVLHVKHSFLNSEDMHMFIGDEEIWMFRNKNTLRNLLFNLDF